MNEFHENYSIVNEIKNCKKIKLFGNEQLQENANIQLAGKK